jgi:protein SCO1/2
MKKLLPFILLVLFAALIWVVFIWQPEKNHATMMAANTATGGDFKLQSANGPVSLKDFRGKVVLIYFGYTWCPDICPTNLSMMSGALTQLDETERAKVQGIFISVDPERDTLDRLDSYTNYFHESILGITATPEVIRELANRYGAAYQKVVQESATSYVVDHSSETYVVDPFGKLVERLPHAATPEEILTAVRKYY